MRAGAGQLTADRGIVRSADDRLRGEVIERLLCTGRAHIGPLMSRDICHALAPFLDRGLALLSGDLLEIMADGLPYARTIAALFDPYRQHSPRRFSSAV